MRVIADLHIHSKYSRATSRSLDLEHLDLWSKVKGLQVLACADFTHPQWFAELEKKLVKTKPGLYELKPEYKIGRDNPENFLSESANAQTVYFLLSTEISCIYKQGDKVRRLHLVIFAPNLAAAKKFNETLERIGNLKADGRPILGISAKRLAEIAFSIDREFMVIPAHIWTPWFAVFGSKSGFNSLEECFEELTPQIYAVETGLSSDPSMNWRLSALDKLTLISNSDAHSLEKLGREANVLEIAEDELSYQEICRILKEKDQKKFLYTVEFFPEEGKYHFDGHASCKVSLSPAQSKNNQKICPICKKNLTIGVLNRVEELADRPEGFVLESIPYKNLISLRQIIGGAINKNSTSKATQRIYQEIIRKCGNEFSVLLDLKEKELTDQCGAEIAAEIMAVRENKVSVIPGYDGVYGVIKIGSVKPINSKEQRKLFE